MALLDGSEWYSARECTQYDETFRAVRLSPVWLCFIYSLSTPYLRPVCSSSTPSCRARCFNFYTYALSAVCRLLYTTSLSGTLPERIGDMTALSHLCVHGLILVMLAIRFAGIVVIGVVGDKGLLPVKPPCDWRAGTCTRRG